ncbi:MAG: hypothetical protein JW846_08545 [Dehalococcoidia bacterium]|nr:hypothetical protein [Dehalococcoidia bacterium]
MAGEHGLSGFLRILALTQLVLLLGTSTSCASSASSPTVSPSVAPIHVSIVCHNEEPRNAAAPAYAEDQAYFLRNREATIEFARMLHDQDVMFNFQSDWDFVKGELKYDRGSHSTGDKNVLRYLVQNLGFEVDPHAHEKRYTYADVAFLHGEAGVPVSHLAGGFVAYPPSDSKLEYFRQELCGQQHDCTWSAEALWGGSTSGHVNEEELWISGIWKPMDNTHFLEHDDDAPLPHIGGYRSNWDGLANLLEHQRNGDLEAARIYTQTIFVRQADMLRPQFLQEFKTEIQSLQNETSQGLIRWVGLNELLAIWEDEYAGNPNMYAYR